MKLIILSGAEATCKSSLAKGLSNQLGIDYRSKDIVKEQLFDTEQHNTWDFGWFESRAKNDFFKIISDYIKKDKNVIIESNFIGEDKVRLSKLLTPDIELIEIHCHTRGYLSLWRVIRRNETKNRHPGHHDRRWYAKVLLQTTLHLLNINIGAHKTLSLSSRVLSLDTTDYPKIDIEKVKSFIAIS